MPMPTRDGPEPYRYRNDGIWYMFPAALLPGVNFGHPYITAVEADTTDYLKGLMGVPRSMKVKPMPRDGLVDVGRPGKSDLDDLLRRLPKDESLEDLLRRLFRDPWGSAIGPDERPPGAGVRLPEPVLDQPPGEAAYDGGTFFVTLTATEAAKLSWDRMAHASASESRVEGGYSRQL